MRCSIFAVYNIVNIFYQYLLPSICAHTLIYVNLSKLKFIGAWKIVTYFSVTSSELRIKIHCMEGSFTRSGEIDIQQIVIPYNT